ncbi:nuclear transport factor 2 family protein [Nonomuraea phyllanthi]|uniref:Nuclear transport factor 2 family protein n=1 Tax=Nonomuraea phyllanthi TaxID=2219224 RepID=A0A5C4W2B4_9ACTN|nr:nuclear transport factor 2 family protein [Nonomuraea phyllanthi]KAB8190977.1 nuclear transport factor 2 family protein [Nonomuraea phyllanthi]QFY11972.1 nuclear transport factor 2 family protein [Nonomuraea phyllanthi]
MYQPSNEELKSVEAWFAEYDAAAEEGALEKLADLAVFPMNLATDVPGGYAAVRQWTRAEYVEAMKEAMGGGTAGLGLESRRTPHFLSPNLVVVETEATMTVEGQTHHMHYADLLVRTEDGWAFQTMVQGGWGHGWPAARRG